MTVKPTQADLDKAHEKVCRKYAQFRAEGGTSTSPYVYFHLLQSGLRRQIRNRGRGDFEIYELLIVRDDGTQATIDLRYLAPDVFGEPDVD